MPLVNNRFMTDVGQYRDYLSGAGSAPPDYGVDPSQAWSPDTMPQAANPGPMPGGAGPNPPAGGPQFKANTSAPAMQEWLRIAQQWGLDPNGPFMDDPSLANASGVFGKFYQKGDLSTANLPRAQLESARAAYQQYQQEVAKQRDAWEATQRRQPASGAPGDQPTGPAPGAGTPSPQGPGVASGGGPDPNRPLTAADLEKWRAEQAARGKADTEAAQAAEQARWDKWAKEQQDAQAKRDADAAARYQDTAAKFGKAAADREAAQNEQFNALTKRITEAQTPTYTPEMATAAANATNAQGMLYKALADQTTRAQGEAEAQTKLYNDQAGQDRQTILNTVNGQGEADNPFAADQAAQQRYLMSLRDEAAPEAFQKALDARVNTALVPFQKNLQDIRETAVRRGVSGGLPTSYEGDLASAFQRNIANAGASAGVDLLGLRSGITSDLYNSDISQNAALQGRAAARTNTKLGAVTGLYNTAISAAQAAQGRYDQTSQNYQGQVATQAAREQAQFNTQQGVNDARKQAAVGNTQTAYGNLADAFQSGVNNTRGYTQDERDWAAYQTDRGDAQNAAARARSDANDAAWSGLAGTVAGFALGGPVGGALGNWLTGRKKSTASGG